MKTQGNQQRDLFWNYKAFEVWIGNASQRDTFAIATKEHTHKVSCFGCYDSLIQIKAAVNVDSDQQLSTPTNLHLRSSCSMILFIWSVVNPVCTSWRPRFYGKRSCGVNWFRERMKNRGVITCLCKRHLVLWSVPLTQLRLTDPAAC